MPKKPLRIKIEGDWEAAAERMIKTPKPKEGWPKPPPMPQRAKKSTKKK